MDSIIDSDDVPRVIELGTFACIAHICSQEMGRPRLLKQLLQTPLQNLIYLLALITVNSETLLSKWMGQSEKFCFTLPKKVAPCIIVFIDEVDHFLASRAADSYSELSGRVKAQFLIRPWGGLGWFYIYWGH
jgi:hypothetical protein